VIRSEPPVILELPPLAHASGTVRLPGSKSISIRALLLAALAAGSTELRGVLDSEDTRVMKGALHSLGVPLADTDPACLRVSGAAHFPAASADLFVGNSGLSARTLVAALAFMGGHFRLHGVDRMHERPIGDLVAALRGVGASIRSLERDGFLPLEILPGTRRAGETISVRGTASSQFLTGLLQAGPLLARDADLVIEVEGELISRPYVALTLDIMRRFGVPVEGDAHAAHAAFSIPRGSAYTSPGTFHVEGDASSASYFLGLGALAGGPVRVVGVDRSSAQADARFADVLQMMGVEVARGENWIETRSRGIAQGQRLEPFDLDLNHMPDAAMTLAVLALFASGPSRLRNIGSWRVKETDRLSAMACELAKLGAGIEAGPDSLRIDPPAALNPAVIETYDDHRMAMAFSLATCGQVSVGIVDPGCVAKTFPDYFERFAALAGNAGAGS
jgi:3-phosphoshikimate 1-carboxyvinyltransferase